jgi:putative redox protein
VDAVTVRHEANDRFRISIRGHDIVVDQPPPASGDAGPTPTELFVASLAACAAFYARRFLSRHGLADGGLVVRSEFGWAPDHSRVTSVALVVEVPGGVPDHLEPALLRAVERCTVHESIRNAPAVTCEIAKVPRPDEAGVGAAS